MNNTARHVRAGGSVLIMVIGVLTILFMLGATFLAVSHMNAKQSAALAEKAPADPAALGVLTTLVDQIRADLAFSTTGGRYTNNAGGVDAWKSFIDCPMVDETAVPKRSDPWLACTELLTAGGTIPYISDPTLQWVGTATKDFSATGFGAVDTDGDGYMDSRLYDTGITNDNGEHYWAAVCVRDASALLNVNVAAGPWPAGAADAPSYTSPIAVDLAGFLGGNYSLLNNLRTSTTTLSGFNRCAASVMSATPNYQPYAIGDETFLRFIGTAGGQYASNFVGRLCESNAIAVKGNLGAQANRRLLTTYNGSSQIGRTGLAAAVVHNLDITAGGASYDLVNSSTVRDLVYDRVESFLSQAGLGGSSTTETGLMAASFVANLWAYLDGPALAKAPWAYTRNNVTAYGTIPGCVITEIFAGSILNTGPDDWAYCFAIEVWNPTNSPISFRILESDNKIYTLAASGQPNDRQVYAWFDKRGSGDYAPLGIPSNPLTAPGWNLLSGTAGDLTATLAPAQRRISIVRVDAGGNNWPSMMDTASAEDAGYSLNALTESTIPDTPEIKVARRDDSPHRARYNVAAYKTDNVHNLGTPNVNNPNALNPADVDAKAAYPYPIVSLMGGVRDIGELNRIYFAAATDEPGKKRAFSQNVAKATAVGAPMFGLNWLTPGRLDLRSGIGGGAFPDVPLASALGEYLTLTPGDTTRLDNPSRVYGKVNVNTATREVLRRIFPASATTLPQFKACDDSTIPASAATIDWDRAVEFILAYREQRAVVPPGTGNVSYVNRDTGSNVPNLRTASKFNGFLTAGEVAIPLADYAHELMGNMVPYGGPENKNYTQAAGYVDARDAMYRSISNLITVNSDVFVVNMVVQLQPAEATPLASPPRQRWHYVAVIDRGNCFKDGDTPAVLLFSEVK